ncbi:MAG: asparaginase [Candidatus Zixiibacteriota bacterium]|nr:MAG: asparaginase [candidate division Zixibacteria bacterium]
MTDAAIIVHRGDGIDTVHSVSAAVVDAQGNLTHVLGDPEEPWIVRSSVKPFQVLPLILSGGFDHFGFSTRQLALMCASHNGTDEHREVALSILKQAGNSPDDLQCGTHLPLYMQIQKLCPLQGEDKDPLRHNCSGKHAGFLALSRYLDEPVTAYLDPHGKLQQMVKRSVAAMCDYPEEQIAGGIDGCSAPTFAIPVRNIAIGFMRLATVQAEDDNLKGALSRVREAIQAYPKLVSGDGRFDYDLMRSFPNNVIAKVGAEAIQAIGFADPPLGICVKIRDGKDPVLAAACVEILNQLGLVSNDNSFPHLQRHFHPPVRNNRDLPVGYIEPVFKLKKVV